MAGRSTTGPDESDTQSATDGGGSLRPSILTQIAAVIPFQQIGATEERPLAKWMPALASLLAAACVAVLVCPVPGSRILPLLGVAIWAVAYVVIEFAVAAPIAWAGFSAFRPAATVDVRAIALRLAATGVWFLPLMIFVVRDYSWSAVAAGIFAVVIARLLRWFERTTIEVEGVLDEWDGPSGDALFWQHWNLPFTYRLRTMWAAICFQAGALAAVIGHPAVAAFSAGLGCFLVAWWTTSSDLQRWNFNVPALAARKVSASLFLAVVVTAVALLPYTRRHTPPLGSPRTGDNLHSGAILLPEVKRYTRLVAPIPPRDARKTSQMGFSDPISIPFSGEYWFYYWPLRKPPGSSLVVRGIPTSYLFSSVDQTPLAMEARQHLSTPIDPRCCSRIDITIYNADPLPGAVSVELILVNSALPGKPAQSLAEAELLSAWDGTENKSQASGTLRFALAKQPAIREVNEFRVVFHLHKPRMHVSANVAIDSFYLIPRGL